MDRATVNSPFHTWPQPYYNPEWNWLWSRMLLCFDPTSYPPWDMGGWCHPGSIAYYPGTAPGPSQGENGYGPAMVCPNANDNELWRGWQFGATTIATGTELPFFQNHWTLALGFDQRIYMDWAAVITAIYCSGVTQFKLNFTTQMKIQWFQESPDRNILSDAISSSQITGPHTVVIVTRYTRDTRLYVDGRLAASADWGSRFYKLNSWYIAADLLRKSKECLSGGVGPYILTRHAWNEAQVAQFHACPWGFLEPAWEPQLHRAEEIECEIRTRPAIEGSQRTQPAIEGDTRSGPAIEGDTRAKPGIEGEIRSQPGIEGSIRTRRK